MDLKEQMNYLAEVNYKLNEIHAWLIEVCEKFDIV